MYTVVAMHIQVSKAMVTALRESRLGYVMKRRGEVEIKVTQLILVLFSRENSCVFLV